MVQLLYWEILDPNYQELYNEHDISWAKNFPSFIITNLWTWFVTLMQLYQTKIWKKRIKLNLYIYPLSKSEATLVSMSQVVKGYVCIWNIYQNGDSHELFCFIKIIIITKCYYSKLYVVYQHKLQNVKKCSVHDTIELLDPRPLWGIQFPIHWNDHSVTF